MGHGDRGARRLAVLADDAGLTPHAGLAVVGDLARHLGLVSLIDGELALERRARPVRELTDVEVVRLGDVGLRFAVDEGEGIGSVAEWRSEHERFWDHGGLRRCPIASSCR